MVLTILALWQVPEIIRPLIETLPVNGHFLSIYVPANNGGQCHSSNVILKKKNDDSLMTISVLQRHVPLAKGDLRCQVRSFHRLRHGMPNSIYNYHTYNELKSYVTNAYWAQFEIYIL